MPISLNMYLQRQLINTDGSASDTTIEVKLRHPGKHDRNIVSIVTALYWHLVTMKNN